MMFFVGLLLGVGATYYAYSKIMSDIFKDETTRDTTQAIHLRERWRETFKTQWIND